ncbi:MAG: sensor histidine kinase, partial [Gemmatimonadales bacterium]
YRDRTARTLALETQLSHAHLQYLQRQLQPHFLFNCLNAIAELAHEGAAVAERMLRQLRSLLATALGAAQRDQVTVREEMAALAPYLELQRTRFGGSLTVDEQVSPEAWDALVPNLVLQPLVENAIQHGLRSGRGRVNIDVATADARLRLRVRDNGVGMGHQRPTGGIGLRNTLDRLQQLYGSDFRFTLHDGAGGGAVAELEIPLLFGREARVSPVPTQVPEPDQLAAPPEPLVASTPPEPAPPRAGLPLRLLAQVLLVWSAIGTFWMWQIYFLYQAMGQSATPLEAGRTDLASAGIWALLTPLVLLLARRVRVTRGGGAWKVAAPIHAGGALAVAALHVLGLHATGLL